MKVHFWAHGESFSSANRQTELAWIEAYAAALREGKFTLSQGPSSFPPPLETDILHLFGAGHFETLRWIPPGAQLLLMSPFSFTQPSTAVASPENPIGAKLKSFWRGAEGANDKAFLDRVHGFLVPSLALPRAREWGIPSEKILAASSPIAAAQAVRDLLRNREGIRARAL